MHSNTLSYLEAESLVLLLVTSKYLAKAASNDYLWKELCKQEYASHLANLNFKFQSIYFFNLYPAIVNIILSYSEVSMLPDTTSFFQSYRMPYNFISSAKVSTSKLYIPYLPLSILAFSRNVLFLYLRTTTKTIEMCNC